MKTPIYIFLMIAFAAQAQAQNTIVTLKGDTLNGSFSLVKKGTNEFVDFTDSDRNKKRYRLFDIKQITTEDGETIEPIKVGNRYTFGKVVSKDYLSLYNYRSENSNVTFNQQVLINYDGSSLTVPGAIGFKKTVSKFLKKCPDVSQKVSDKDLDRDDLEQIITEYNGCIKALSEGSSTTESVKTPIPVQKLGLQTKETDFNTLLKYADSVKNKADVADMFKDVMQKLSNNQQVPNYLKELITNAVSSDTKLSALIKEILK